MRISMILMICVLSGAVAAVAQVDPGPNGMGIYADLDGLANRVDQETGVPMEVYLLLTNPTGVAKLGGWECRIVVPDNVVIWGWNHPHPGTMTFATPPDFMSVFTPIPYAVVSHLMTFIIVPLDEEPAQFYLEALPGMENAPLPRYLDVDYAGGVEGTLIYANPYPGGPEEPSFVLNGGMVPTVAASWGEVRALYR